MIQTVYDHERDRLYVLFGNFESIVHVDKSLYPQAEKVIEHMKDIDYSKKSIENLMQIKASIWQLRELLKSHLNRLGTRDQDYKILESEYKSLTAANYFLFLGIHQESGNIQTINEFFENPILAYN